MATIHSQYSPFPHGYNLLNNGGFTQYTGRHAFVENTAADRTPESAEKVDASLYGPVRIGFPLTDGQDLGFWRFAGPKARGLVSPTDERGDTRTSRDGGNLLKIQFLEGGELLMEQELLDTRRFEGVDISAAFTGVFLKGEPLIEGIFVVDDVEFPIFSVSAAAFGDYRRVGGHFTCPDQAQKVVFRLKITGQVGEEFCIGGVSALLGYRIQSAPFVSSFIDRAVPSGVTYMVTGEACPPGYYQVEDGRMALVSGTTPAQRVNGQFVTQLGLDRHDHNPDTPNTLTEPSSALINTFVPLGAGDAQLVHGAPFQQWPASIQFNPFPDEVAVTVLGERHSHRINTEMDCLPPTFPVRFCKKL